MIEGHIENIKSGQMNVKNWPFEVVSLAFIFVASTAGWFLGSHKMFAGIWAGGLIGIVNFKWLGSIVKGALTEGRTAGYTVRYLLKFIFVIGISALLIFLRAVDPLGFMIGFSIIVITVSLKGIETTRS